MSSSVPELAVEVVWFDEHMLELSLRASNPSFAGRATFYAGLDEAQQLAKQIEGFPRAVDDTREYEFGGDTLPGYGGAKIRLSCKDGSGHLLVQVSVYATSGKPGRVAESSTVEFASVPAAIDSFVEDLQRMQVRVGDMAILRHA